MKIPFFEVGVDFHTPLVLKGLSPKGFALFVLPYLKDLIHISLEPENQ